MSRWRIVALVLGLGAGLVATVILLAFRPADRPSYVAANNAVLRSVPVFPGAQYVGRDDQGYKDSEWAFATTAGYISDFTYRVSLRTRASRILSFYRKALSPAWHLTGDYPFADQLNFQRGAAYLEVVVAPARIDLRIDHDCPGGSCGGP